MSDYEEFDLEASLDEVADLVAYTNPPAGTHVYGVVFCGVDVMGKDEKEQSCIRIIYQKITTEEKVSEGDLDAANGSLFSENFGNNDNGRKYLKARLKSIFGQEIKGSFKPYIDGLQEQKMSKYMLKMTTSVHTSRKDGQEYENVRIKALETIKPIELPESFEEYEYNPGEKE